MHTGSIPITISSNKLKGLAEICETNLTTKYFDKKSNFVNKSNEDTLNLILFYVIIVGK